MGQSIAISGGLSHGLGLSDKYAAVAITTGRLDDKYHVQKIKLGEGAFGTVWRAVDRDTGENVAVKQLTTRRVQRADIEREVRVMQACPHQNIIRLHAAFEDNTSICIAVEYCDGGDLSDKIQERGKKLREYEAVGWAQQICSAVAVLHTKGICHRDIKPDNFMLAGNVIKLVDFGLAIAIPTADNTLLFEKCGSPAFMAPEQHKLPGKGYGLAVDVWAGGLTICMTLLGGRHPFVTNSTKLELDRLKRGDIDFGDRWNFLPFYEQGFSEAAKAMCRRMVDPGVSTRITAEQARRGWEDIGDLVSKIKKGDSPCTKNKMPEVAKNAFNAGALAASSAQHATLAKGDHCGALSTGNRCRFYASANSSDGGWAPAIVTKFNASDSTYDLATGSDEKVMHSHVQFGNIGPDCAISAAEAWAPGTRVCYMSKSTGRCLPAIILSFNEKVTVTDPDPVLQNLKEVAKCLKVSDPLLQNLKEVGTYNLDVREQANIDQMRLSNSWQL